MNDQLPQRDEEPTLGLIRQLRDAVVVDEALMQRALSARRPEHVRRIDAAIAKPSWDDLQLLTAQLATKPLFESVEVDTQLVLGLATRSNRQTLASPLFVQFEPPG
ncbi:MAG: hypothetical protein JWN04_6336, partial [Myxococcaceae bacterium]|nr:hypothetical protein [Myxococcaceae bacterium]